MPYSFTSDRTSFHVPGPLTDASPLPDPAAAHPAATAPPLTRAVILARGLGTRMRAAESRAELTTQQADAAQAGLKAMIPIGRPFLDFVLSALADAGYAHVCLVIGPEHDSVRHHYAAHPPARVHLTYAVQDLPRGTADALLAAEGFADGDSVLVLNGDNYYPVTALSALRTLGEAGTVLFDADALSRLGNVPPERLRAFALADVDADGYMTRLVEKPDERTFAARGPHALISMNMWRVPPAIFAACRAIEPSSRGELELPHAVEHLRQQAGVRFRVLRSAEPVFDLSRQGDIAPVAAALRHIEPRP